ncbi:MAG: hypothetical protein ACJ8AI_13070 [Rhodopila sp.]
MTDTQTTRERNFSANPYTSDEERVATWLRSRTPEIGAGDDPIGFVLASYELVVSQRNELAAQVTAIRKILNGA